LKSSTSKEDLKVDVFKAISLKVGLLTGFSLKVHANKLAHKIFKMTPPVFFMRLNKLVST
jgi:hypothetical protein